MRRRLLLWSGLLLLVGGIALMSFGPGDGLPNLAGQLCLVAGAVFLQLNQGVQRKEWPGLGVTLGLVILSAFLYNLGQPNGVLKAAGQACISAALLFYVCWKIWQWRRANAASKRARAPSTASER
jgi:hypothetical protein